MSKSPQVVIDVFRISEMVKHFEHLHSSLKTIADQSMNVWAFMEESAIERSTGLALAKEAVLSIQLLSTSLANELDLKWGMGLGADQLANLFELEIEARKIIYPQRKPPLPS